MKEYPLKADNINAALQETGLSWTIVEEDSWAENHTVFTLENDGGKYIYSKVSVWKSSFADASVTIEMGVLGEEEDRKDFLRIIFNRVSEP